MQIEVNELKGKRKWSSWGISALTHCVVICGLIFLPGSPGAATPSRAVIVTPLVYEPVVQVKPLRVTRPLVAPPVRIAGLNTPVPEKYSEAGSEAASGRGSRTADSQSRFRPLNR